MGMRKTTVRLSDRLWELVQSEAEREGITGAQYIREAVIARVFYERGRRGAPLEGAPPKPGDDKTDSSAA